ncbi:MAG TPA: GvpL/GvpF family gas vesicle protein [Bryobacteraceae bacterium]|nr:GvpL/GvpF family gas vesicle protein [Bryobacteraceae bacterium]
MRRLLHCIFRHDQAAAGEPIGPDVCVVHHRGLGAAASDWHEDGSAAGLARLLAYEKTIERLHASRTVIPLRFGCLMEDQAQILRLLDEHREEFAQLLDQLEGLEEMGLRVWWESVPEEPLPLTPGARHLAAARRSRAGLTRLEEHWGNRICSALAGLYVQQRREGRQASGGRLVSLHFLVPRASAQSFRDRARWIAFPAGMKSLVSGPWPPYHFVDHVQH